MGGMGRGHPKTLEYSWGVGGNIRDCLVQATIPQKFMESLEGQRDGQIRAPGLNWGHSLL